MILAASLFQYGCDNGPDLENTTDRMTATIDGTFFTESPDDLIFPVKVLFALDCSGSMGASGEGSDPTNERLAATRAFVEHYNSNPNVSFEIMLWNSHVRRATMVDNRRGFTKDIGEIEAVLDSANNTSLTDYVGTLEAIHQDIQNDIVNVENQDSLVRTKYVILFFSDGLDNLGDNLPPREQDILNAVDDMYEMATEDYGVRDFSFHTFFLGGLSTLTPEYRRECIQLLASMAERGHGGVTEFENASLIDFIEIVDLNLVAEYQVKFMVAYNFNVVPGVDTLYVDSDGDGLSDERELNPIESWWRPTDPNLADTDGDGWSDYFEYRFSTWENPRDPTTDDTDCDALPDGTYPDSDWDGLNNCEERYKGTHPYHPDTDHDGIPDSVEFYAGTNPLEDQVGMDTDFDGAVDWFEIQRHTNVKANDPVVRSRFAYSYDIIDQGFSEDMPNMRLYDFNISNISIMRTGGSMLNGERDLFPGDNVIRLFIAQVPEDMPTELPVFRVADVVMNFDGSVRRVTLYPADFQLLE
jgi:hypothetical protein